MKFLPKHQYYRPLKNRPNHHHYRPKKIEKIAEKKIVRNFLHKIKISFFFEFFTENVLKTLLRGRETTRKNYRVVFEKFLKYVLFFNFACPSTTTIHHHHHHPSIKKFRGSKKADYLLKIQTQKSFPREDIKEKETQMGPHRGAFQ